MQSTKSTILENWQGPVSLAEPARPTYHFAVKQSGVNLDFHLSQFFRDRQASLHLFDTYDQLLTICQRWPVDLILIGGRHDLLSEIEMVRAIKQNVFDLGRSLIFMGHCGDEIANAFALGQSANQYGGFTSCYIQGNYAGITTGYTGTTPLVTAGTDSGGTIERNIGFNGAHLASVYAATTTPSGAVRIKTRPARISARIPATIIDIDLQTLWYLIFVIWNLRFIRDRGIKE